MRVVIDRGKPAALQAGAVKSHKSLLAAVNRDLQRLVSSSNTTSSGHN
jgi:predicted component of type VI protein secretion system